ncbi:MAG: lysophospholipid acyltransferase family protein [Elusimicrobia bacterium]|nr:lysophospholipid acyltransferase family protein [Elusimicrobiota bacterium]
MIDSLLRSIAPYLAYVYMTLVGRTCRFRWEGMEHPEALRKRGVNFIYAFWHNRQLLFSYTHRDAGVSILVSRSRDGELIAKAMELSRIDAVRGSSSRGATAAARELLDLATSGKPVGITPDGPKGPAGVVKPGVLYLALKTGLPILPISNATSRKVVFQKSWDRFQMPLPFARCCIVHGAPIHVSREDDLGKKGAQLSAALDTITAEAERRVGNSAQPREAAR